MATQKEQVVNIERLEIMEEKFGITLEGLNAQIKHWDSDSGNMPDLNIYGEIHAANGTGIEESVEIVATAFDTDGKVIVTGSVYINKEDFFALENIDIAMMDIISIPVKVRVYPKKG